MNENINLEKKKKNAPKGTKLWSPICGECELERVSNNKDAIYPITCKAVGNSGNFIYEAFTANGAFSDLYACSECVLFPSKENRDWATFKVPEQHKHFEPFQKVLSITDDYRGSKIWAADFFSHYGENLQQYYLVSGYEVDEDEVIPYEGNEDLLGKVAEK